MHGQWKVTVDYRDGTGRFELRQFWDYGLFGFSARGALVVRILDHNDTLEAGKARNLRLDVLGGWFLLLLLRVRLLELSSDLRPQVDHTGRDHNRGENIGIQESSHFSFPFTGS